MSVGTTRRSALTAVAAWALSAAAPVASPRPQARVIDVVARKFEFVPGELRVRQGQTVILRLTAPEVPMGLRLPDFNLRTDIVPGKVATLEFTADRAGSFTFLCDVFCGSGHEEMSGVLVVS
jgi:cytochrome c oxidase subunit 2